MTLLLQHYILYSVSYFNLCHFLVSSSNSVEKFNSVTFHLFLSDLVIPWLYTDYNLITFRLYTKIVSTNDVAVSAPCFIITVVVFCRWFCRHWCMFDILWEWIYSLQLFYVVIRLLWWHVERQWKQSLDGANSVSNCRYMHSLIDMLGNKLCLQNWEI